MTNHTTLTLFAAVISTTLGLAANGEETRSIKYGAGASQVIITDLGLLPGGTTSAGPGNQQRADHCRPSHRQQPGTAASILERK